MVSHPAVIGPVHIGSLLHWSRLQGADLTKSVYHPVQTVGHVRSLGQYFFTDDEARFLDVKNPNLAAAIQKFGRLLTDHQLCDRFVKTLKPEPFLCSRGFVMGVAAWVAQETNSEIIPPLLVPAPDKGLSPKEKEKAPIVLNHLAATHSLRLLPNLALNLEARARTIGNHEEQGWAGVLYLMNVVMVEWLRIKQGVVDHPFEEWSLKSLLRHRTSEQSGGALLAGGLEVEYFGCGDYESTTDVDALGHDPSKIVELSSEYLVEEPDTDRLNKAKIHFENNIWTINLDAYSREECGVDLMLEAMKSVFTRPDFTSGSTIRMRLAGRKEPDIGSDSSGLICVLKAPNVLNTLPSFDLEIYYDNMRWVHKLHSVSSTGTPHLSVLPLAYRRL